LREILWLRLDAPPADQYSGVLNEAELLGYSISTISSANFSNDLAEQQIGNAAGYIITHTDIVGDSHLNAVLKAEIESGKRILVNNPTSQLNGWLIDYDIALTTKKFFTRKPRPLTDPDGTTVILQIESQENELATSLMRGNYEIEMDGPRPVWYGKNATPLLVASDDMEVVNRGDRLGEVDVHKEACAVVWPVGDAKKHQVLVLGGFCINNPLLAGRKQINAGLPANRRFVKNLLRWVVGDLEVGSEPRGNALQKLHAVEVSMLDVIKGVLQKEFGDCWWYEIPIAIRQAAAQLHEERKGKVPKEGCLHFIHLATIVENHWRLFEPVFVPKRCGKKELSQRFKRLNELRNRLSHPARLLFEPLAEGDFAFVDGEFRFFSNLANEGFQCKPPKE
jgi:hypothetical protein